MLPRYTSVLTTFIVTPSLQELGCITLLCLVVCNVIKNITKV